MKHHDIIVYGLFVSFLFCLFDGILINITCYANAWADGQRYIEPSSLGFLKCAF